jgi:hypothetical protein
MLLHCRQNLMVAILPQREKNRKMRRLVELKQCISSHGHERIKVTFRGITMRLHLNCILNIFLLNIIVISLFTASKNWILSVKSITPKNLKSPTKSPAKGSNFINSLTKTYSFDVNLLLEGIYSESQKTDEYFLFHSDKDGSLVRQLCDPALSNRLRSLSLPRLADSFDMSVTPSPIPCLSPETTKPQTGRTLLVISTFNALQETLELLSTLERVSEDFDIVVIDDASTDGTADFLIRKVVILPRSCPPVSH